jgi:hypothetical protein
MTAETEPEICLADDLLHGVAEISAFIGESRRRTFYLLERGLLPAGKMGATWIASKSVIRASYDKLTGRVASPR